MLGSTPVGVTQTDESLLRAIGVFDDGQTLSGIDAVDTRGVTGIDDPEIGIIDLGVRSSESSSSMMGPVVSKPSDKTASGKSHVPDNEDAGEAIISALVRWSYASTGSSGTIHI